MLTDPRCDLKLYIEHSGYSCPIMGASISTASKMTATITVLPTPEVRQLVPMTNVIVAYRDPQGADPQIPNDVSGVNYSVLFIGMVTGVQINKSATQRSAQLSCEGHYTLLERHYTYVSNIQTQGFSHMRAFMGASAFFRAEFAAGGIARQVADTFKADGPAPFTPGLESLTGPSRGALRLIEKCIGVTLPAGSPHEGKAHGAQHEFFAHASYQARLLFQIGGVSVDAGLSDLLDKSATTSTLSNAAAQLADSQDLATVLDILLKQLYFTNVSIGTPVAHLTSAATLIQRGNVLTELRSLFSVPRTPTENLSPEQLRTSWSSVLNVDALIENTFGSASELNTETVAASKLQKALREDASVIINGDLVTQITTLVPESKREGLYGRLQVSLLELARMFVATDPLSPEQGLRVNTMFDEMLRSIAAVAQITEPADAGDIGRFTRVVSYLFLPQLTFCTPPTCNVIFPAQVSTFSYNKPAFYMPTRLLLHSQAISEGTEQNGGVAGYYAPSLSAFSGVQGDIAHSAHEIPLLEHEKFTGIVPSFASLSFYDKFRTFNGNVSQQEMMLRIANFNLMLQRYQTTTISCSGPFNPFVAVGFPIAFIDVDDIYSDTPSVFVGMLTSVSHDYAGNGSMGTSYSVQSVREVGEVDRLFGDATMRSTFTTGVVPIALHEDANGTRYIKDALAQMLSDAGPYIPLYRLLEHLAARKEITASGATKEVRSASTSNTVTGILQRALPQELRGSRVVSAAWDGLEAVNPGVGHRRMTISFENTARALSTLRDYFVDVPHIQSAIQLILTHIGSLLPTKIRETLTVLSQDARMDTVFSEESLAYVQQGIGMSVLQVLNQTFTITFPNKAVAEGKEDTVFTGAQQCTLFSLLPISITALLDAMSRGRTTFFDGALEFPSTALTDVGVYASPINPNDALDATAQVAVEELYRPPWFSDDFSVALIGERIYRPTLKCGSVQDAVSPSVEKTVSITTAVGAQLTHTTQTSLMQAYLGYRAAVDKAAYVSAYVRRPIAHVLDVIGTDGLLTTSIGEASVVDLSAVCGPGTVKNTTQPDKTTTQLTFQPAQLVGEKRAYVDSYVQSTKGDAFR